MNERIKELSARTPLRQNRHQSVAERREELEKFTELIIKECQDVLYMNQTSLVNAYNWGRQVASNDIADRFGFERRDASTKRSI